MANREDIVYRRVLILGDYHISRLQIASTDGLLPAGTDNFGIPGLNVYMQGTGGITINKTLTFEFPRISTFEPEIVFLHVGGNDLTSSASSPDDVAQGLFNLARTVSGLETVRHVDISSLCFRHTSLKYNIPHNFKEQCLKANTILLSVIKGNPDLHVWGHKFSCGPRAMIDGVHFTHEGQVRFFKSIRSCLALAVRNKLEDGHPA